MKIGAILVIVVCSAVLIGAQRRWYLTGKLRNDERRSMEFHGSLGSYSQLFYDYPYQPSNRNTSYLFDGGMIALLTEVNNTVDDLVAEVVAKDVVGMDIGAVYHRIKSASFYDLVIDSDYGRWGTRLADLKRAHEKKSSPVSCSEFTHGESLSCDFSRSDALQAEIGLYDHRSSRYMQKDWIPLEIGQIIAIEIVVPLFPCDITTLATDEGILSNSIIVDESIDNSNNLMSTNEPKTSLDIPHDSSITASDGKKAINPCDCNVVGGCMLHRIVYTRDRGQLAVLSHTWGDFYEHSQFTTDIPMNSQHPSTIDIDKNNAYFEKKSVEDSVTDHKSTTIESISNTSTTDEQANMKSSSYPMMEITFEGGLKVMTYNLWHNNPPSWVYTPKKRWSKYLQRLR